MIKKFIFAALTVATLAAGSANAGPFTPVHGLDNDRLIYNPNVTSICYGCTSSVTGLPRTEYVRPHYNSGNYVSGYYRSRSRR
jgi:hypothetical protein